MQYLFITFQSLGRYGTEKFSREKFLVNILADGVGTGYAVVLFESPLYIVYIEVDRLMTSRYSDGKLTYAKKRYSVGGRYLNFIEKKMFENLWDFLICCPYGIVYEIMEEKFRKAKKSVVGYVTYILTYMIAALIERLSLSFPRGIVFWYFTTLYNI